MVVLTYFDIVGIIDHHCFKFLVVIQWSERKRRKRHAHKKLQRKLKTEKQQEPQ